MSLDYIADKHAQCGFIIVKILTCRIIYFYTIRGNKLVITANRFFDLIIYTRFLNYIIKTIFSGIKTESHNINSFYVCLTTCPAGD